MIAVLVAVARIHLYVAVAVFFLSHVSLSAKADVQITSLVFTLDDPAAGATANLDSQALIEDQSARFRIVVDQRNDVLPRFVFFSIGGDCADGNVRPVIAVFRDGEWNSIKFDNPEFRSHRWTHVYQPADIQAPIYALSRVNCADSGDEIFVYRSFDSGVSWRVSRISVYYMADFLSIRIDEQGSGEIMMQVARDYTPVAGQYVFRTSDWGATWAAPEFRPSLLGPAAEPDGAGRSTAYDAIQWISEDYAKRHSGLK
jgi:hypothetical protein